MNELKKIQFHVFNAVMLLRAHCLNWWEYVSHLYYLWETLWYVDIKLNPRRSSLSQASNELTQQLSVHLSSPGIYCFWKFHFPCFSTAVMCIYWVLWAAHTQLYNHVKILTPWVWNQTKVQRKVFSARAESFLWADVAVGMCWWWAGG